MYLHRNCHEVFKGNVLHPYRDMLKRFNTYNNSRQVKRSQLHVPTHVQHNHNYPLILDKYRLIIVSSERNITGSTLDFKRK